MLTLNLKVIHVYMILHSNFIKNRFIKNNKIFKKPSAYSTCYSIVNIERRERMKFSIKIGKIKMTLHFQILRKRKVKKSHRSWS